MRSIIRASCLCILLATTTGYTAPPETPPATPTITIAPGGTKTDPPVILGVRLSGSEFEILTLTGYAGVVTWDISSDVPVPIKLFELKAKESVVGIRAGGKAPDRFESPDTPSVAIFAVSTGRATITAWGVKEGKPTKLATFPVDANVGPRPPPVDPVVPPVDPVTVKSFRVIFILESADTLTGAQNSVIYGKVVEDFLNAKCTGGKTGWRRRDKDSPGENDATMAALWAAIKPTITTTPCVAIELNGKVDILPLEATPAAQVAKFKTYLGEK